MTITALAIPSLHGTVSPEEWAVRVDLAAAYRPGLLRRLDRIDPSYRT